MRAQVVCRTVTGVSRAGADEVQLWVAATNASNPCRPDQDCPADFNEDGVVNAADLLILLGKFGPCPESSCVWDVNGDGMVDHSDLFQVLNNFGPCDGCPEDVNGDGVVDGQDVAAVAKHFGPCP